MKITVKLIALKSVDHTLEREESPSDSLSFSLITTS